MYRLLIMLFTATAIAFQAVASDASADEKKCSAANGRPSREQFAKIQATTIAADLELDEATTRTFVETYLRNQKEDKARSRCGMLYIRCRTSESRNEPLCRLRVRRKVRL